MKDFFTQRIKRGLVRRFNNLKVAAVARSVVRNSPPASGWPVVFFKASTGIDDLSWNSGFHLLASWALRLKGIPVAYFACHAGMSHCVLGTNRDVTLNAMLDEVEKTGYKIPTPRDKALSILVEAIQPKKSHTFRSGKTGGWKQHFTDEHKDLFKEVAGDLLVRLGYEQDNDW